MNVTKDTFEEAVRTIQKAGNDRLDPTPMRCDDPERERALLAVAKAYGTVASFDHQGAIRDPN